MKIFSLRHIFPIVLLSALLIGTAFAQRKPVRPPDSVATVSSMPGPSDAMRRQVAFATAWETLNQQYYDKTFGGVDWNKVRAEFAPRVAAAKTDHEFHALLAEMIKRLGRSHLAVIEPEYFDQLRRAKAQARIYEKRKASGVATPATGGVDDLAEDATDDETEGGRYGIGVDLRVVGDQFVISHVEELSGAKLAGLKPGYELEKINGVPMQDLLGKARIAGYSDSDIRSILPIEISEFFLNGGPETNVYLTCLDETDKPVELKVPRLRLIGQTFLLSPNLPEQFLEYEARSLSPEVGYIKFNAFAEPVIAKFCDSIGAFKDKKAIVLDLRGNVGGVIGATVGLAGMLTGSEIKFGDFVSRRTTEHFVARSRPKHFSGKLIVLIDGSSMSAAEMFAAGLKASDRVVTVGTRTAGKCLPAVWTKLQTGAVLMYPIADLLTPQAGSLEGHGLEPDISVPLDRKSLIEGRDLQLEKALAVANDDAMYAANLKAVIPPPPASDEMAPPPRALPKPVPKMIGTGTLSTGASVAAAVPANQAGPLKTLERFRELIGGDDAIAKLKSYDIRGELKTGTADSVEFHSVWQQDPGKFMMEYRSVGLGDIREIYSGKKVSMQTGVGYETERPSYADSSDFATLTPLLHSVDLKYLRGLKDEGPYEGRQIVSAHTPEGLFVGMSFDQKTGLLATFTVEGVMYTMSDYRKVDGMLIPFRMDMDRGPSLTFRSVKLNSPVQASDFERKPQCFDAP